MVELHHPWVLAVPIVSGLGLAVARARGGGSLRLGGEACMKVIEAGPLARGILRAATVLVLALVAAGPHSSQPAPGRPEEGIAIVVALDVSESMRDEYLGGSPRLEVAIDELERFVDGRTGDAIGLVTFAGDAVSRVPPILDRAPMRAAMSSIRREASEDGTALGTAIGVAANRLRALEARSRVLVAITDGESNAGALDPETAAAAAATLGVRIYTVGVGGLGAATLSQVAVSTGGRHFEVTDLEGLDRAYREIDALEPSSFESANRPIQLPKHAQFLWLASLLMVAEGGVRASKQGGLP